MIVILGNGGHAKVLADIYGLRCLDCQMIFGEAEPPEGAALVIGVGDLDLRRRLFLKFTDRVIRITFHPKAVIARSSTYKTGLQLMAGAIIQPGCKIGNNVLINTRASVDHDCIIGDHVHVAPGAILCGNVTVGEGAFIGAGAIIPEGRVVPARAFVKAGEVFRGA